MAGLFGNIINSAPNYVGLGLGLSLALGTHIEANDVTPSRNESNINSVVDFFLIRNQGSEVRLRVLKLYVTHLQLKISSTTSC